jgi:WNT inhibitory factor 1
MRSFCVLSILQVLLHLRIVFARHEQNSQSHHYTHYHQYQTHHEPPTDLSIWISEQQVKLLSGYSLRIFAIENGRVSHLLRDPAFDSYLPMIPPEVSYVNFTWTAGHKKYRYHFDQMTSMNEEILQKPIISIKHRGKIPQEPKREKTLRSFSELLEIIFCFINFSEFSVMLPCSNLTSGIAKFTLGLLIMKGRQKILPGTPLRFTLRKECSLRGMNSSIDYSPHSQGSVLISALFT